MCEDLAANAAILKRRAEIDKGLLLHLPPIFHLLRLQLFSVSTFQLFS